MSQIELILSRHGETEENKLHIMQGQLPGHLSELGKQQAKALAETLDKEELDVIVCSDLARSYDTAMAVARQKGLQPVATPLLPIQKSGRFCRLPEKGVSGKADSGDRAWRLQPCHRRAAGETAS